MHIMHAKPIIYLIIANAKCFFIFNTLIPGFFGLNPTFKFNK